MDGTTKELVREVVVVIASDVFEEVDVVICMELGQVHVYVAALRRILLC